VSKGEKVGQKEKTGIYLCGDQGHGPRLCVTNCGHATRRSKKKEPIGGIEKKSHALLRPAGPTQKKREEGCNGWAKKLENSQT